MTLDFLVMGVASFGWGMASDRFGTRVVVLAGAVLLGLGLLLASRTTSLIEFQLTYGVLVGMAFGPLAGGWIFDTFNSYSWLYIGSLSVAVGAIAMALAFLPLPLRPRDTLQPA
jgi:MFS family permease